MSTDTPNVYISTRSAVAAGLKAIASGVASTFETANRAVRNGDGSVDRGVAVVLFNARRQFIGYA